MKIANRLISPDHPPYIIAEIGVNHDGSIDRALELVEGAARAGADAIKLQFFRTDLLLSKAAQLAAYQTREGETDPVAMLRRLELNIEQLRVIAEAAQGCSLHAILSVFSVPLVAEAEAVRWDAYKIASPDIIHRPLIEAIKLTGRPTILSCGAATLDEIREASGWLGDHPHLLMQCVSSYPTNDQDAALAGREAMMQISKRALGYSDHTTAEDTGALAVASGARLLEKHLTYDRTAKGPDHASSLDPEQFAHYVTLARRSAAMLGPLEKVVLDIERDVRAQSRQSLTATETRPAGHVLEPSDITIKRPGSGIPPQELECIIGRALKLPLEKDFPITWNHLA